MSELLATQGRPVRPPRHNHMTRDIKRSGLCPACDAQRQKLATRGGDSVGERLVRTLDAVVQIARPHFEQVVARSRKSGSKQPDCACEVCQIMHVINETLRDQ